MLEKEKKTAEAKKISDDRLERIAEQNAKNMNGKTSHGIMEDWKESQKQTGMKLITDDSKKTAKQDPKKDAKKIILTEAIATSDSAAVN